MNAVIADKVPPTVQNGKAKRLISLQQFLERYSNREDNYKYEWQNGVIEKTTRTTNRNQFPIYQKLVRRFLTTQAHADMGELIAEVDMYIPTEKRTRRADIAYLTEKLMKDSASGQLTICPFVIEVISKNDQINEVHEKLAEYFQNGVEIVWLIFPKLKKVEVHRSLRDVQVCLGEDVCSAVPVLPDYEISVKHLFS